MKPDQVPHESFFRRRFVNTVFYSWQGLRDAWTSEEAFRIEVALSAALLPFAIWLGRTGIETALMIGSLLLVLIVELLNTALEKVVDRISTESHALSRSIKDIGSAAVLLSLILAFVVWAVVLIGRFT